MKNGLYPNGSMSSNSRKARNALFSLLAIIAATAGNVHAVDCVPGLYATSYDGKYDPAIFQSIDITTGIGTQVGPIGFNRISAMDIHPTTGILYAVAERHTGTKPDVVIQKVLISIDRRTGAGTQISELTFGIDLGHEHIAGMSFDSAGTLYGYGSWDQGFYTIDVSAGTITRLGVNELNAYGNALAFSPAGVLYHVGFEELNTVDLTTGLPTWVADLYFGDFVVDPYGVPAMDYGPETGLYYALLKNGSEGNTELTTINVANGAVSRIGSSSNNLDALVYSCEIPDIVFKDSFESP